MAQIITPDAVSILASQDFDEWRNEFNDVVLLTNDTKSKFNDVEADLGLPLSNLTTTDKTSIIAAIVELKTAVDLNTASAGGVGTIASLTTTDKTSAVAAINELHAEHGTLTSLTTTAKGTFVAAINEVDGDIGALASLTTTDKTDLVSAANELDVNIGDLTALTTTVKTSSVTAINELDGEIGVLSSLNTTDKSTLVAAINEIEVAVGASLASLTTTDKSSLVNAINELHAEHGDLTTLTTTAKGTFVVAINELDDEIGTLSSLTTTDKSNLVAAINEIEVALGADLSSLTTTDKSSLVNAINELHAEHGTLSSLTTTAKDDFVDAINELDGEIGVLSSLITTDKTTVVAAINELALSTGNIITYAYSDTITDADPGNGIFRFNSVTISAVTEAYIDNLNAVGDNMSAYLDTFDNSTNTIKGTLNFSHATDPEIYMLYHVTGSVVDGTGYRKLTLTHLVSGGTVSNTDVFDVQFHRAGDQGSTGAAGADGSDGDPGPTGSQGIQGVIGPTGVLTLNITNADSGAGSILSNAVLSGSLVSTTLNLTLTRTWTAGPATCFIAGTLVKMYNGLYKKIEDIIIGDKVTGLFGMTNEVIGLDQPILGDRSMWNINDNIMTTDDHAFWSDKGWNVLSMPGYLAADKDQILPIIIDNEGTIENRKYHGIDLNDIREYSTGDKIGFNDTFKEIETLEEVSNLPADTLLYSLVLTGSHTMMLNDGYVFSGWARDDDFDYSTGLPIEG